MRRAWRKVGPEQWVRDDGQGELLAIVERGPDIGQQNPVYTVSGHTYGEPTEHESWEAADDAVDAWLERQPINRYFAVQDDGHGGKMLISKVRDGFQVSGATYPEPTKHQTLAEAVAVRQTWIDGLDQST